MMEIQIGILYRLHFDGDSKRNPRKAKTQKLNKQSQIKPQTWIWVHGLQDVLKLKPEDNRKRNQE